MLYNLNTYKLYTMYRTLYYTEKLANTLKLKKFTLKSLPGTELTSAAPFPERTIRSSKQIFII